MQKVDLLQGPITPSLAKLAFPIMGTALIQMAYNMTDMIWIGRISSNAVAAVGAAGMYLWLANGLVTVPKLGGQVCLAQALGSGDREQAAHTAKAALHMGTLMFVLSTLLCLLFNKPMIGFFALNQASVVQDARIYLVIVALGFIFTYLNQVFTGLFTAMGASTAVFRSTVVGLAANIVLDPVLIFGLGPIPAMGVAGAAIATVFAQGLVFAMFLVMARREETVFPFIHLLHPSRARDWAAITRVGAPPAIQSMFFASLSMIISRLVTGWGDAAVAVQKVGSQIESISWMTAEGFASAVNAFMAQNYGAGQKDRIRHGFWTGTRLIAVWGVFTSLILIFLPQPLFRLFIPEPEILPMGVSYLRILGFSQMFSCIEIVGAGAFQGLGHSVPPTLCGMLGNLARIPMALALSSTVLGLDGIWWAITFSSIFKGLSVFIWFCVFLHRFMRKTIEPSQITD